MSKLNPENSTSYQMLLDCKSQAVEGHFNNEIIIFSDAVEALQKNKMLRNNIDAVFDKRKYNDKKLSYYKHPNQTCIAGGMKPIQLDLKPKTRELLDLFRENMNQFNVVGISPKAQRENGFHKRLYASSIKELIDTGCIIIYRNHSKTNPTLYEVSTQLGHYGNYDNREKFFFTKDDEGNDLTKLDLCKTDYPHFASRSFIENDKAIFYNMILARDE